MVTVGVSEFRTNLSAFLQRVQNGEIISLIQRGNEIARIVPPKFAQFAAQQELARLRETAVLEDVLSPLDMPWDAE